MLYLTVVLDVAYCVTGDAVSINCECFQRWLKTLVFCRFLLCQVAFFFGIPSLARSFVYHHHPILSSAMLFSCE